MKSRELDLTASSISSNVLCEYISSTYMERYVKCKPQILNNKNLNTSKWQWWMGNNLTHYTGSPHSTKSLASSLVFIINWRISLKRIKQLCFVVVPPACWLLILTNNSPFHCSACLLLGHSAFVVLLQFDRDPSHTEFNKEPDNKYKQNLILSEAEFWG